MWLKTACSIGRIYTSTFTCSLFVASQTIERSFVMEPVKDIINRRYVQIYNESDVPLGFYRSYSCKLYTLFRNDLNPDVIYYILLR